MTVRDVRLCECWARDGLQSWPSVVPLEEKLEVLRLVAGAGIGEVDATSLVPPKYAPQFADAAELLGALNGAAVRTRVLAPNLRGVERAVDINEASGALIHTIGFPISASEAHNLANVRRTHGDHLAEIERMVALAHDNGLEALAALATSFGCPLTGAVDEATVFALADRLVDLGVDRLMLSDTTGLADPTRVTSYTERALREYPQTGLVAHFHDSRGTGIVNTYAAVLAGVTCVDACLGGIGGEPATVEQHHAGETGNISTEDITVLLERAGFRTGVDVEALENAGRRAEAVLGRQGRSQVLRSGAGLAAGHAGRQPQLDGGLANR